MNTINPRRPLDDDKPDGYMESDRDFVLNNLDACVAFLEPTSPVGDGAFDCQYCSGHHTAENACVRYRQARAKDECDNCHESGGRHLVGCPIGHELASPTGDAAPASDEEWRWETIEEWNQVIIYMPWSDKVKPSETAMFGDYRGTWIAKLEYNNGVPTRAQAEANAAQIVREHNTHRKLVEALGEVVTRYNIARDIHWRQLGLPRPQDDETDTIRSARAALTLAEAQQ